MIRISDFRPGIVAWHRNCTLIIDMSTGATKRISLIACCPNSKRQCITFIVLLMAAQICFGDESKIRELQLQETELSAVKDPCESFLADPALATDQVAWSPENFSDPRHHNPNHYQYVVHAAPPVRDLSPQELTRRFLFEVAQSDFNKKLLFDASIISEVKSTTFNRYGVVLHVPKEKIMAATSDDMRSHASTARTARDSLARAQDNYRLHGLPTPSDVLAGSEAGVHLDFDLDWSDILIYGGAPSPESIRVVGYFYQADSLGNPLVGEDIYLALNEVRATTGMPLIPIPPPVGEFVVASNRGKDRTRPFLYMNPVGPKTIQFLASRDQVLKLLRSATLAGKPLHTADPTRRGFMFTVNEALLRGDWTLPDGKPDDPQRFPPEERKIGISFADDSSLRPHPQIKNQTQ